VGNPIYAWSCSIKVVFSVDYVKVLVVVFLLISPQ
jgi:hypothetical protein